MTDVVGKFHIINEYLNIINCLI